MIITQDQIDDAILTGKGAGYKLAYELVLEENYGGKVECCYNKLNLIWMWVDALACENRSAANVCLTDTEIKSLIGKIKTLCNA